MSWFSQISSKAEALLVKLDQDAAEALQNSEGLLRGTKLLDQVISISETRSDDKPIITTEEVQPEIDERIPKSASYIENDPDNITPNIINDQILDDTISSSTNLQRQSRATTPQSDTYPEDTAQTTEPDTTNPKSNQISDVSVSTSPTSRPSRKFTIQTSRTTSRSIITEKRSSKRGLTKEDVGMKANGTSLKKLDASLINLGADDIRASINQSLQDYAVQSTPYSTARTFSPSVIQNQTAYTSHFDSQPNLVHSNSNKANGDNDLSSSRLHSSPSFSIEVPEERVFPDTSDDNNIASHLLKQSVLKKQSTFYLHKVINRLANTGGKANTLIGDETRIKFRRAQLRATSYLRRLNYYFRAYPLMKYVMLIYLVIIQLLIVYVLFFYQSSSSPTDLSSQINKQQEELGRLQSNSDASNSRN